MFDQLSFSSIRLIAIYCNFVITSALLWTKYDSLSISLKSGYTIKDFSEIDEIYTGIVGFGLFLIVIELLIFSSSFNGKSFGSAMHLLLDIVSGFFNLWIMMDGLDWRTYIYILVFCLIIPIGWDIFCVLLTLQRQLWVRRADVRRPQTWWSYVSMCMAHFWNRISSLWTDN